MPEAENEVRELTEEERAELASLDAQIAKFEGQKRWSDMIRSIVRKGELVSDPSEKVELFAEGGRLYLEKASNQAEAIKCFEQVLEHDPQNLEAIEQLKAMYEKRRDWESLVRVRQRSTALMDEADRLFEYVEIATLATQRLRKPELCIELWEEVRGQDPENSEALDALAHLYERARRWEPLAQVLDAQVERMTDEAQLRSALSKLGMIYADKIGDNEGAVRAFSRLLELSPDDRRAQEQLKRRYIALKAWDDLEDFYARTEKWSELIRTLEREAESKDASPEDREDLLFRAARLWQDREGKPDRAARAFEKILAKDEGNLRAAEALSPIYEEAGDARKLARVYEIRLGHLEDPASRIHLLRETGLLYEEKLRQADNAYQRFVSAFQLDPTLEILQEDVARMAKATRSWDPAVKAYQHAIEGQTDADVQVELRLRLGDILVDVGKTQEAIAQFRAVYDDRGDNPAAIAALELLYRETKEYRELLDVYERRMELEEDAETRKKLAYGRASLWEQELSDPEHAIEAYQRILDEYGDHEPEANAALDRLYQAQERWEDLAHILERRIELGPADNEELAALKFRLADLQAGRLNDRERALELYREVLVLMPEHDGARAALERLLDDPEVGVWAASILEPIYEMRGSYEPLLRALEVLAAGAEDDPDRRLSLLNKIGEVAWTHLNDSDRCFDAFARGFAVLPHRTETLSRLEALAIELNKFGELVKLIGEVAAASTDRELSRELFVKAAQLYESQLDDVDNAVRAYSQVLEQDSADTEVLDALEALYRRTERWPDLLEILNAKADLVDDPEKQEALFIQNATIYEESLGDRQSAIRVYAHILEIDPTSRNALSALDRLYELEQRWSDLADNINRQLAIAQDHQEELHLMLRLADLRERRMGAVDAAIEIYREVLDRDPTSQPALAALERLIEGEGHQLLIADILEPIYRGSGQVEALVKVHEIQAAHANSSAMRIELLHQIAELHESALGDLEQAFGTYARALAEDASDLNTQDQLERIAASAHAYEPLANVYEERVQQLDDPPLSASLYVKAAVIREEHLGDVDTAIAHYQQVLRLDELHLEAAGALERLFQSSGRYDELAQALLHKARILPGAEDQKEHLFRAAALYEEVLERPDDAIATYQRVLEVDSEDVDTLDKLVQLYMRLERWPQLLSVYEQKADVVYDPDEKKRLFLEVGAVYERELGDVDRAIDTYQRILEIDPDDLTAIGRLDALYQASGNWQELLSILEREADLAIEASEVISYRYRIADLWNHKLGDAARAVEGYREILDVMPDHGPTLEALEGMIQAGKEPLAASLVLEPIYSQYGWYEKLAGVLDVQVAHDEDPIRRVELLHRLAEIQEELLQNPSAAFEAYGRALVYDNANDTTMDALERLAGELGAWQSVAELYDGELAKLQDGAPEILVELALRAAQLYYTHLGSVDSAIARYRIVLRADEVHPQAMVALDRLYEQTEQWSELADILQREINLSSDADEVLHLQYRLAYLYQCHLNRVDEAIEQYRDILSSTPDHPEALAALEELFRAGTQRLLISEILEPLYRMSERWDRLVGVHQVQLASEADPHERVQMMHRIAGVAEDQAMHPDLALVWMQRAFMEEPTNDHSVAEMERLAEGMNRWDQVADTFAGVLSQVGEAQVAVENGRRLARIYEEELGDVQRAVESYLYVLRHQQDDAETLEALDRIYADHGAHEALAEVLRARANSTDSDLERVDLSYRLAQVLENDLGRIDEAVQVYRYILNELDREHPESAQMLENIYVEKQDWGSLLETLERDASVVVSERDRALILAKMARVASTHLGEPERAIELWKEVLDLRGEDMEALNALGALYAAHERWGELVEILDREAMASDDAQTRCAIYGDMLRIFYSKLGKEQNAIDCGERILDIDPGNVDALFSIADIYRRAGQHRDQADTLHRLIDTGQGRLDAELLERVFMQLGDLYEVGLDQALDAVEAYDRALAINPMSFGAMDALERIHRAEEAFEACVAVMERRVEALADPHDKVAVLLAIAATWELKAERGPEGIPAYERVLEFEPMNEVAFDQLEELYEKEGRWEDMVELYLNRIDISQEKATTVDLYRRVGRVQEVGLNDLTQARAALMLAWEHDFTDQGTAEQLERVAGLSGNWNEPLELANQTLQALSDSDDREHREIRIAICLRCAKWYGQELGHPEHAVPYYNQILALDPANFAAMQSQADLYRHLGQWQRLAQMLGRMADVVQKAHERAEVYNQMGELCEGQLSLPDQAPTYYKQALENDPSHLGSLRNLERLYAQAESWTDLLDILQMKVSALAGQPGLTDAKLQVAEVHELRLAQVEEAISVYKEIRAEDGRELRALHGLERLYSQKEKWQELFEVLEAQLDLVNVERDQIAILSRLAAMLEEEFLKPERAAERLEQILEIDPSHEEALRGLQRLYRNMQRWDDLIVTLERHVAATPDRNEKVACFAAMGDAYAVELDDAERAIDAYLNLLSIDAENVGALDALTRLYEKREEHESALDCMGQLARLIQEPERVVDLRYRMGRVLDVQLGDRAGAVDAYRGALDIDPGHLPSLEAMRNIQVDEGDWLAAARTLEQETQYQTQPRTVAQLMVELGRIYQERLDEYQKGVACFEAARERDPDSEDAALPLAEEYLKQERWADAYPLLDMLVKRSGKREPEEQHRLAFMLGEVAMRQDDPEAAVKALTRAHQLDQHHLPTVLKLASAHFSASDWDSAFRYYQMMLVHHRESLAHDELTDVFYRLGVVKREQGDRRKALNMFDKALEEDPQHRPTLDAMLSLQLDAKDWEQAIHYKRLILDVADGDERFQVLDSIGDLFQDKVKDTGRAIESYAEASSLEPDNHKVLHKLLMLYQQTKQWDDAIDIIQRISDLDQRQEAKAKYAYTIAVILRDEMQDIPRALKQFSLALDLDIKQLKAFEAINRILNDQKDWKQLERAFRKMLHRLSGSDAADADLEYNLWHNLGVIYRDRLKRYESAVEAFKIASQKKPEGQVEHQILAELYTLLGPEKLGDAIDEHQWLLRHDPYRVESYQALYRLYFDARAYDKAWCLAATLTFLKKADKEQQQFYLDNRQAGPIRPQARLDNERWLRDLVHPTQDLLTSKLFELLWPAVLSLRLKSDREAGLNKKHEVDPATNTATFAQAFGFVANVLGLPTPRLFLRTDVQGGLSHLPVWPQASLSGATLLKGFHPQDLMFVAARHMSDYRGEHYMRTLLPSNTELKSVLMAGLRIVGVVPQSDPAVEQTAGQIAAKMQPAQRDALKTLAKRFVEAGARTDIKKWLQAVELTACRAGLLVCNDLETAGRMVTQLPPAGPVDLSPRDKVKELVLFSVSEQYFRLREHLGIRISLA